MGASGQYCESISLPNNLGIRNIADLHATITSGLAAHPALALRIPDDAEADLSFVQLVEAARLQAKTSGKSLRLSSPANGSVLKVLQRGGFIEAFAADDAQFWFHKEVHT